MLSRIADSLFWLNRYMERADGMLRVTRTHYILSLDKGLNGNLTWRPVLEMFTNSSEEKLDLFENDTAAVLKELMVETRNTNSLKAMLNRARENARGVQDHITKEVWEQVNQSYHAVNQTTLEESLYGDDVVNVLDSFSRQTLLYTGVTDITMPRGLGWSFMNLGKHIERCLETLIMTNKQFEQIGYNLENAKDIIEWRYLLLCLSGYELHLKTYRTNAYNYNVLHQVLFNEDFTRSVVYSLRRIDKYLKDVVIEFNSPERAALLRCFGRLHSKVQYMDLDRLNTVTLQEFLAETKDGLLNFSKQLSQSFFSYS